jgi:ankyrin repeat protein
MSKGIDLTRFPSLQEIVSSAPDGWSDSSVPIAQRGVRLSWLVGMLRNLLEDINRPRVEASEEVQRAFYHNKAGTAGLHDQPDMAVPSVPNYTLLNVRSLVDHFVLPLTAGLRAPLWAYVPEEHRGVPDYFVSHTWSSLLLGPPRQAIGTLDAIEHLGQHVWIDFVSYNQHTIESIPTDMEAVVGKIGKVVFAGTPIPMLARIWCLWELLCANRTGIDFDIAIRPGFRNDKILAVNTFYRSFVGVEKAVATKPEDRKIISEAVLAQFGSAEAADKHLDRALRERFSGSWYELRERDQHLGFRPWPWLYEQGQGGEELARSPARETDDHPYFDAAIRDSVIYGSQQATFDLLIESGLKASIDDTVAHQFRTSSEAEIALVEAAREGDLAGVRELLEMGTEPDRPVAYAAALAHAARRGHTQVVELLLNSGADIEGGNGLSPLTCAAYKGQDEIVRLLIDRGADIEADTGGTGTALFQAADEGHPSTVRLLLDLGAAVDAKTEKRATPLLVATAGGHFDIVVQLIEAGADLNCTDRSGDTALHHAAHNGSAAIVRALVAAGADRAVVDKYGDTAFAIGEREQQLDAATLELLRLSADAPKGDNQHVLQADVQANRTNQQSPLNLMRLRTTCLRCGKPVEYMHRPRYIYSEEPGSPWADFLRGLSLNRCACGLVLAGSVSSFHTLSWTAVTLEPPEGQAFPAETFAALATQVLTGVQLVPPLLLFQSFDAIQQAVSRGASERFLLIPFSSLIYQDVSETAQALRALIAKAVSARLFAAAYLFIKNAAVIHPDLFWVFFNEARQLAQIVDNASSGEPGLLNDLESVSKQLAEWRKVPSLDREAVFVCFGDDGAASGPSAGQTYYALGGYFDAQQNPQFSGDEKACTSLPSWLLPKPPLSVARKCLLDVHIHASGEFLLRHDPTDSETIAMHLRQARERIENRYSELSEAQRAQLREFYGTLGGLDLRDGIGNG